MRLILVRHAEAVEKGVDGITRDFDRPLTENGREQAHKLSQALRTNGIVPGAVVTSPLVRARETAEPLKDLLPGPLKEAVSCDYLAADELRPKRLLKFVMSLGVDTALLVGHNPDLSAYASWLLGASETAIELEKGAAALITFAGGLEKGEGRLEWLITPSWFMGTPSPA